MSNSSSYLCIAVYYTNNRSGTAFTKSLRFFFRLVWYIHRIILKCNVYNKIYSGYITKDIPYDTVLQNINNTIATAGLQPPAQSLQHLTWARHLTLWIYHKLTNIPNSIIKVIANYIKGRKAFRNTVSRKLAFHKEEVYLLLKIYTGNFKSGHIRNVSSVLHA